MKFIKRPTAIRFECRQVDEDFDLWDMHYEEEFLEKHRELAEQTVAAMAAAMPVRIEGNLAIVDLKSVGRHDVFTALASEFLLNSSAGDLTLGDILGFATQKALEEHPDEVAKIYEPNIDGEK